MTEQQSQELLNQADRCFKEGNIDRAINIAESLALQKDMGGIEKVCAYRYARMISVARIIGPKDYDTLEEDCNGVINAGNALFNMWKGLLDAQELWPHLNLTADIINEKMNSYRFMISNAIYCLALVKNFRDHDSDGVIALIGSSRNSREKTLCGLAYLNKEEYDIAFAIYASVYADAAYNASNKWDGEQILYESALVGLANYKRLSANDYEEAVRILNTCLAGVTNEEVRSDIQKELSRYKKNIFGKWTYN